jgi:hypothetical protein
MEIGDNEMMIRKIITHMFEELKDHCWNEQLSPRLTSDVSLKNTSHPSK